MAPGLGSLLIGTRSGLHRLGEDPGVELDGHDVGPLVSNGDGWLAVVDGRSIWRSGPEGWDPLGELPAGERANCVAASDGAPLVGSSKAGLHRMEPTGPRRVDGFDRTEGREGWYTPWGGPPDSRSIDVDEDGTVYVNVHVGGIPRSRDGGRSWEPTIDVDADVHQVIAPRPGLVLAATALGLAISVDGGDTWRFETDGLHATYCRAVALSGDVILVSVSRSHRGDRAALYRRALDAGPFERCREGLPQWFDDNVDTHWLAAGEERAAVGTPDGRVFASTDGGSRWDEVASGLASIRCVALA